MNDLPIEAQLFFAFCSLFLIVIIIMGVVEIRNETGLSGPMRTVPPPRPKDKSKLSTLKKKRK